MTDSVIEIRIHGRGGQGNVAAAELLALAAFKDGYEVQAFPAFGAERAGSPVQAFVRLAHSRIRVRSQIYQPDVVIVQDPDLARDPSVFAGIKPGGTLILNAESAPELLPRAAGHIFAVPATAIALEVLGRPMPNAVMLGAFIAATGLVRIASLAAAISERFKPEVAHSNTLAAGMGRDRIQELPPGTVDEIPHSAGLSRAAVELRETMEPGSSSRYHTSGWRTSHPVFKYERCNGCDLCAVFCPEGIISARTRTEYEANYDFCKGCGICAVECPVGDIEMVAEARP